MKVRQGFVSNSSSSSFVLAFPKKMNSVQDVKDVLFGGWPEDEQYQALYHDCSWSIDVVAEAILNALKSQTDREVIEEVCCMMQWGDVVDAALGPYPYEADVETQQQRYLDTDRLEQQLSHKLASSFIQHNQDCCFYVAEFSDNEPLGATLEHGCVFDKVPHIRISRH